MRKIFILIFLFAFSCVQTEERSLGRSVIIADDSNTSAAYRAQFEEALFYAKRHPYDPDVRRFLGNYYLYRLGKHEKALEQFRVYARLEPDSARAQFKVGEALLYLKRMDEAIKYFERALECDSDYPPACLGLYKIYEERGEKERARIFREKWKKAKR
jgi:tetratricopeptide (TPR) repeat protein